MTDALAMVGLIVGPVAAYVVILTLPRWFTRSLHRHRIWRLRDVVVDDVLAGELPRDHPAVQHLIGCMGAILREKRVTLLNVYIFNHIAKGIDPTLLKAAKKQGLDCPLDGLTPEQRERVELYRQRFTTLLVGSMLLGSWFGIAHIVRFVPAGLRIGMHQAKVATRDGIKHRLDDLKIRFEHDITATAREATDLAATQTRIGQTAMVFAARHDGEHLTRSTTL